jgi:hypothetical protein
MMRRRFTALALISVFSLVLSLSHTMADINQKIANTMKHFFSKEIDARTLLRGAGNLVQLMQGLNALADNVYNVVGSNNLPKSYNRRQLLCLKLCKCTKIVHYDVCFLQTVQHDEEVFGKFIYFTSAFETGFFNSRILFCIVINLFEAAPKVVRVTPRDCDGPLFGPLVLFTILLKVAKVLSSLWASAYTPSEHGHEAVRLLFGHLDTYRAHCLRDDTAKLAAEEKMKFTVDKFRSSTVNLSNNVKRTKVLDDVTNAVAGASRDFMPASKRQRVEDDLALSSDDDDTTVPKPSAAVKPTGASADGGGACAAADDGAEALIQTGPMMIENAKDTVCITLCGIVRMYQPMGELADTDTISLEWMEANHETALRSLKYELEQRKLEAQNGLPRNPLRHWHGPHAPARGAPDN